MVHLPTLKRESTKLLSSLMCIHTEKRLSPANQGKSFLRFFSTPFAYILVSHFTNNVIYFKPLARMYNDQINQYNISNFTHDVKLTDIQDKYSSPTYLYIFILQSPLINKNNFQSSVSVRLGTNYSKRSSSYRLVLQLSKNKNISHTW